MPLHAMPLHATPRHATKRRATTATPLLAAAGGRVVPARPLDRAPRHQAVQPVVHTHRPPQAVRLRTGQVAGAAAGGGGGGGGGGCWKRLGPGSSVVAWVVGYSRTGHVCPKRFRCMHLNLEATQSACAKLVSGPLGSGPESDSPFQPDMLPRATPRCHTCRFFSPFVAK